MVKRLRGRAAMARQRRIKLRDGYRCRVCGVTTEALQVDHVTPLYLGGVDTDANLQCLCAECHAAKTRRDLGQRARPGCDLHGNPLGGWRA